LKAQEAISAIHNYALDKKHTLAACQFEDFNSYLEMDDELRIPKSSDLVDLHSHMFDAYND